MSVLIQRLTPAYYAAPDKALRALFFDTMFRPVLEVLKDATAQIAHVRPEELLNAAAPLEPLQDAIRSGQVQYDDGVFSGDFRAAISRPLEQLGATFDKRRKVYRIRPERVPAWIRAEAGAYRVTAKQAHAVLVDRLGEMSRHIDETLAKADFAAAHVGAAVKDGFRPVAKAISISPDLNETTLARIKATYNENMKLKIKGFSDEMIGSLRDAVEDNALDGYRFDRLVTKLRVRYGVTTSKAKFLARNESSIFMATYRENRFAEVGVTKYRWSTSLDERVRPDHAKLQGLEFSYASPPVVDHVSGRRCNPGKDYGCRCADYPIIPKAMKLKEAA